VTDSGTYIVQVRLAQPLTLSVGALGSRQFAPGHYYYVGSARRGLSHRLARHARRDKRLRWHIDYLTALIPASTAWTFGPGLAAECELAAALASVAGVVPGFGASDCRCAGHLFRAPHDLRPWIAGLWPQALQVPLEVLP
jgi:sugar fermentation stimulation protein A